MENLNDYFFNFIESNRNSDIFSLKLKRDKFPEDFPLDFCLLQIDARKKYSHKLKSFISNPKFLFPDSISGEQTSHQAVSKFHASLINQNNIVLDMTGGLGIDSMSIASSAQKVISIEIDENKANILKHNAEILGYKNLEIINDDSTRFIKNSNHNYDIIFVDPSRRGSNNQRLYNLKDCIPDIVSLQDILFQKTNKIIIKASPLIDITQILRDFRGVNKISVIGVNGECKEILIEAQKEYYRNSSSTYNIICDAVNLDIDGNIIFHNSFDYLFNGIKLYEITDSENNIIEYLGLKDSLEDKYILEPSAMIMKIAPWNFICNHYKAKKFGPSTHLFLSEKFPENFPGRVTQIKKLLKKQDRKALKNFPATVICKNYPLTSESLRTSLKLIEGTENFIYAGKIEDKPIIILSKPETSR